MEFTIMMTLNKYSICSSLELLLINYTNPRNPPTKKDTYMVSFLDL